MLKETDLLQAAIRAEIQLFQCVTHDGQEAAREQVDKAWEEYDLHIWIAHGYAP